MLSNIFLLKKNEEKGEGRNEREKGGRKEEKEKVSGFREYTLLSVGQLISKKMREDSAIPAQPTVRLPILTIKPQSVRTQSRNH